MDRMKKLLFIVLLVAGCSSKGDIQIGMNQQEVIDTLGKPYQIDQSQYSNGRIDRWVYWSTVPFLNWTDGVSERYNYVIFEDGIVTSFHN